MKVKKTLVNTDFVSNHVFPCFTFSVNDKYFACSIDVVLQASELMGMER